MSGSPARTPMHRRVRPFQVNCAFLASNTATELVEIYQQYVDLHKGIESDANANGREMCQRRRQRGGESLSDQLSGETLCSLHTKQK